MHANGVSAIKKRGLRQRTRVDWNCVNKNYIKCEILHERDALQRNMYARWKTYRTCVRERDMYEKTVKYLTCAHKDLIACFKRVHKVAAEKP